MYRTYVLVEDLTAFFPPRLVCPECGCEFMCCICGDITCELCHCDPCQCKDDRCGDDEP